MLSPEVQERMQRMAEKAFEALRLDVYSRADFLVSEEDGEFYANLPSGKVVYKDDLPYLQYFAKGGDIVEFMKDVNVWGEDLTNYKDFYETVKENVEKINKGISLI